MAYFIAICALFGAISVAALCTYGADKFLAIYQRRRVPERVLLALSLLGGATGGALGMVIFRHKIRKPRFILANAAGLLCQAATIILAALYLL